MAEMIGTCDQCAVGPVETFSIDDGDASICKACILHHSNALDAATDAARDAMSPYAMGAIDGRCATMFCPLDGLLVPLPHLA